MRNATLSWLVPFLICYVNCFGQVADPATRKLQEVKIELTGAPPLSFKPVRFIPLKNTFSDGEAPQSQFFLGRIAQAFISGDRIYLREARDGTQGIAYIFKLNGDFIWKSIRGKGPGEVLSVNSIAVDPNSGELIITDAGLFIHRFSSAGKFIKKTKLPCSVSHFTALPGGGFVCTPSVYQGLPFKLYRWTDAEMVPLPIIQKMGKNNIDFGENSYFQNFQDSVLFSYFLTDTIYSINSNGVHPFARLDFGKYGVNNLTINQIQSAGRSGTLLDENSIEYKNDWYSVWKSVVYCHANDKNFRYICRIDLENGNSRVVKLSDANLFGITFPQFHFVGHSKDGPVFSVDAEPLGAAARNGLLDGLGLEQGLLQNLKGLNELSNQVLVIVN